MSGDQEHEEEDRIRGYSTEIGLDGHPVDPKHPLNRRPESPQTVEAFLDRELSVCERAWVTAHNFIALFEAVKLCHQHGRPLPRWTNYAVLETIQARFRASTNAGRGRAARPEAATRNDLIHYSRWDTVRELRDRKEELKRLGYDPTWEAAYWYASEALEGTVAAGSHESMKRSYQLVKRAMKTGNGGRFYVTRETNAWTDRRVRRCQPG